VRRALIDIGTNTAHLLIGDVVDGRISSVLHKKRFYTFLGVNGLDFIAEDALSKLWTALDAFSETIERYNVKAVSVIATEGLRSASNGPDIQDHISNHYGWQIKIISGAEEAQLIYQGVNEAIDLRDATYLVMDIGGGSVEMILIRDQEILLSKSYPIGIARLYDRFHVVDPIDPAEITKMHSYLDEILDELWTMIEQQPEPIKLVGCAGTFEILMSSYAKDDISITHEYVSRDRLDKLYHQVTEAPEEGRSQVSGIPPERAQYIVVALALIKYVSDIISSAELIISKYALKEGAIVNSDYFDR